MSVVINTNSDALRIQGTLTSATNKLSQTMQRMSSGLKINSSKDDAAGTVIAARMNVQIDGNKIAQQNVQNANAMLSTAEGNVDVVLDNITRIRDLTLQAKNGSYSADELQAMQDEVSQRIAEIDRVSQSAKYSQLDLFGGSLATDGITFQVGTNATANDVISADKSLFQSVKFNDILTNTVNREAIDSIDANKFMGVVSDPSEFQPVASKIDAEGKPLTDGLVYFNSSNGSFYVSKTVDGVTDWHEGKVNASLIKNDAATAAGQIAKITDEETGEVSYKFCTAYAESTPTYYAKELKGFDAAVEAAKGTKAGSPIYGDTYKFDLTTMSEKEGSSKTFTQAIKALDAAVNNLTSRKSLIGSLGNRLDSALDTLTTQQSNLTSAKSIITDADIASEAASYTQNQILQQVSTSLLAQANQAPSIALSLL